MSVRFQSVKILQRLLSILLFGLKEHLDRNGVQAVNEVSTACVFGYTIRPPFFGIPLCIF
ncbi:hypothetical protein NEIMUCOT_05747 [Neisseria mucosa ATCC 25996]|uniref:Uncharacterized protein n=1 Tax=Neisseria mucosa (strain ATCC 25996 / DSM 4631 / NCTC 10774 / M26) TaxID=546266 RepID=D2ZYN3_NEIM2|nr:hypothetical protein NEIMUCOT_05747 [Neisseria mucosa ATCC 25996]